MATKKPIAVKRALETEKTTVLKRAVAIEKPLIPKCAVVLEKTTGRKRARGVENTITMERAIILEKSKHPERAKSQEKPIDLKRLDGLVPLVDATLAIEKVRVQAQVRISHLKRNKKKSPDTDELFQRISALEKWVDGKIADHLKSHPAYPWFSKIKGIGNENIAKVVGLIDIEKDDTISSLWSFAGYAPGKDKRQKGQKLPYCAPLRTMCYRTGTSLLRAKGKYYERYLEYKEFYEKRAEHQGQAIVPASKLPKRDGKKTETDKFISEGHIHALAFRKMIKDFLAALWITWREGLGLPTRPPYLDECVWCPECNTPAHIHTVKKQGKKFICAKCGAKFEGKPVKSGVSDPWSMTDK